jgi:hypothetical protein
VLGGIVGGELGALPAPTAPPVRVGGNIKEPKKLHYVAPIHPLLARSAHIHGVVIIAAEVDEHGSGAVGPRSVQRAVARRGGNRKPCDSGAIRSY